MAPGSSIGDAHAVHSARSARRHLFALGVETSATLVLATDGSGASAVATMSATGLAFNVANESVVDPHWERHFEVVLLALSGE